MDESHVKTNSVRAWVLAARPKTLMGAAVPVMIGGALALADAGGRVSWTALGLCFLFAFVMQVDANFVNDYFDFRRGNDEAATRLGPMRACSMGWVTPGAMVRALVVTTAFGALAGLPLARIGGWEMVVVGALCVLFCFLYTTRLSYLGLGDVLVLVFFGVVPVCLTRYLCMPVEARGITAEVVAASVACGLVVDTLLLVNNCRDAANDLRDGKRTLVVRVGVATGMRLYLAAGLSALAIGAVFVCHGHTAAFVLPLLTYGPLHWKTYRRMVGIGQGRELNRILGRTAANMFLYGCAVAAGIWLS